MGAGVKVDVTKVITALAEVADGLTDLTAFTALSEDMAAKARAFAPKRTGKMARSITASHRPNVASVNVGAKYGGIINYGYKTINASLFVQRAEQAIRPTVVPTLEREIQALISGKGL